MKRTPVLNRSQMGWIREEFDYVRRYFFPGWDRKYEWRIGWVSDCPLNYGFSDLDEDGNLIGFMENRSLGECGLCRRNSDEDFLAAVYGFCKIIIYDDDAWELKEFNVPRMRALHIHEICHATFPYRRRHSGEERHGKAWQKKMKKLAKHARQLKQPLLAWLIEADARIEKLGQENREELEWDITIRSVWGEEDFEREVAVMAKESGRF